VATFLISKLDLEGQMNRKWRMCLCSTVVALLFSGAAYAQQYTITDLGQTGAWGINDTAVVVGSAGVQGPGTESRATVWTAAHGLQKFGIFPGGHYSGGYAINHYGVVVGVADFSNYFSHAFLSTGPSQPLKDLGVLYHTQYSQAVAINDSGVVAGFAFSTSGQSRAIRWTSSTGMQGLDSLPGGLNSTATGINNLSQIVGYSSSGGQSTNWHACWWPKPNGVIPTDLGTLPRYVNSIAYGINIHAAVVGESSSTATVHAILWTAATGMKDLGLLNSTLWTSAKAINDSGQVVGAAYQPHGNPYHAFIWTQAAGMKDLNQLIPSGTGWILVWATGINATGQITGFGTLRGQSHAFLLTPK
jgi:probable HAF family extracellular repeat protein